MYDNACGMVRVVVTRQNMHESYAILIPGAYLHTSFGSKNSSIATKTWLRN